jgi:hypothetical protein
MNEDLYLHGQASLFAACNALKTQMLTASPALGVFKWDAAADHAALPENDLIGPFKYIAQNMGGMLVVSTQIVVSTVNDTNLFRMDEIVNAAFKMFAPGKRINLIDAATGTPFGFLISSDETTALPIERAGSRPVKSIAIELRADHALLRA